MGSGSNSGAVNMLCNCHNQQRMWVIYPGQGVETMSRHHGTNHVGSLGVKSLLEQLAGTVSGSAILQFVQGVVGT